MSVLLETSLGDVVVDLDVEGSPLLVQNFLKLCEARYYTQTLLYQVVPGRCVYGGDPAGDGTGGACADALWKLHQEQGNHSSGDNTADPDEESRLRTSQARFLMSQGRRLTTDECREKGRLVAVELGGYAHTVGSQFLITLGTGGPGQALDGYKPNYNNDDNDAATETNNKNALARTTGWLSLGKVMEDFDDVLGQLDRMYCDASGRPYADIRVRRALVVYNPFTTATASENWSMDFLQVRGIELKINKGDGNNDEEERSVVVTRSPSPVRPVSEKVEPRIPMEEVLDELKAAGGDDEVDEKTIRRRLRAEAEADRRYEDKSRARVLEMLGDLPDAEAAAPKNVLFVAKLNSITTDEDLQLIFSRFDPDVKVDIIRDQETGQSLQYAFCAFTTEKQAIEAYFKMNQALVDDRRILVDFSQSVSHVWDKYRQQYRNMPKAQSFALPKRGGGGSGGNHSQKKSNNRFHHKNNDISRGRDSNHDPPRKRDDQRHGNDDYPRESSTSRQRSRSGDDYDRRRGGGNSEPSERYHHHHGHSDRDRRDSHRRREEYDRRDAMRDKGGYKSADNESVDEAQPADHRHRQSGDRHHDVDERYSDNEGRGHKRKGRRYDSSDEDEESRRRRKEKQRHRGRSGSESSDADRRKKKKKKSHKRHRSEKEGRDRRHSRRGENDQDDRHHAKKSRRHREEHDREYKKHREGSRSRSHRDH